VSAPVVVWRFLDGKAGHERQSAGLLAALARRRPLAVQSIGVAGLRITPWQVLLRRLPPALDALPAPALLVGAGHACEWPLLAARRARGGRSVYLMKPTLPTRCFDLCLVPRHDGATPSTHVEPTIGVLNDLEAGPGPRTGPIPILIGGPSKHHAWDEAGLLRQIAAVTAVGTQHFVLSDSRRTPATTSAALAGLAREGLEFVSHREVDAEWLRGTLARAPAAWVTADSVSMLFEALSAGCALGVLEVPARRADRISAIAPQLLRDGLAGTLEAWRRDGCLAAPATPLAEAARCAGLVEARLLGSPA
jgi:mitochondrial fission protein ELM1